MAHYFPVKEDQYGYVCPTTKARQKPDVNVKIRVVRV
jgi:hypothetical protein